MSRYLPFHPDLAWLGDGIDIRFWTHQLWLGCLMVLSPFRLEQKNKGPESWARNNTSWTSDVDIVWYRYAAKTCDTNRIIKQTHAAHCWQLKGTPKEARRTTFWSYQLSAVPQSFQALLIKDLWKSANIELIAHLHGFIELYNRIIDVYNL